MEVVSLGEVHFEEGFRGPKRYSLTWESSSL